MTTAAGARRTARHLGPAIDTPGGMAAVLETWAAMDIPGWQLEVAASWRPDARLWGAGVMAPALVRTLTERSGAPDLVHLHLSTKGSFVREGALAAAAARRGTPVVVSLHGSRFLPFLARHPRFVTAVLSQADAVCCLGPDGAAAVRAALGPDTPVVVLPNVVAAPASTTPAGANPEVAVFAGLVGTRKGVDVLLEAWSLVRAQRPTAELRIAGPIEDVAVPADLPGVTHLGVLPRDVVAGELDRCRVAVLPSRAEVMPMFLLEAMARARPVVSCDVGEVAWTVGDAGRVVAPGDAAALAAALVEVLADPDRADRLGRLGADRIRDDFSVAAAGRQLSDLYGSLAGARRPVGAPA